MYYSMPSNLPPAGRDSGSAAAMQAIMAYIGQLQASGGGAGAGPSGPMGLNEYGGQGFDAGGAYSGYNTSIYGNLGAPKTESSY